MKKVLVLGDDTRAFLSVIRSLGRGGVEVHVAWYDTGASKNELAEIALRSRYISHAHDLPSYRPDNDAWKTALIALMQREKFDLVLPCGDPSILPLQAHRHELEPFGRIYVLNERAFEVVFDKFKTNALARSVGVAVPRERVVENQDALAEIRNEFNLPIVLKPQSSFRSTNLNSKQVVKKAYDWEECAEILRMMLSAGPVSVQENFVGDGVGVELLLQDGKPLMSFQHMRVHEPLHGGGSSYRIGTAVSPELLEAALKLLEPLAYTGVAMVEFKVDSRTKQWVLIEINGRFWGSLPLAVASGADFPLALVQLLVDGQTSFSQKIRTNIYCRNFMADLNWHFSNLRADRSDPTLATLPLNKVIVETLVNVITMRERSDTWTLDDPGPGVAEASLILKRFRRSIGKRLTGKLRGLPLVRTYQARKARKALAAANSVLFVCKGNICRSPFAEYYARERFPKSVEILSAGYIRKQGRTSPSEAIAAASKWSLDLALHRSRILTEEMVRAADILFVFDLQNYYQVHDTFAAARGKIYFVGALLPEAPMWIEDPYSKGLEDFESTYRLIAAAIDAGNQQEAHAGVRFAAADKTQVEP